jgi:myo-inositol-1-phosphate synthase
MPVVSGGSKVRVAIVGVGNCASALVQGVAFYSDAPADQKVPGLMHVLLGTYHVGDIEFSAAFDVARTKVGLDLSEAIHAGTNDTLRFAQVGRLGVPVHRGPTLDGLGCYLREVVEESEAEPADVAKILRETATDVLVCYLPVGSEQAAQWYARCALEAGVAMVNCIPVFIGSDPIWHLRFKERGLPLIGDDIKSQVGATIMHRMLADLFTERGVRIDHSYQLNVGGNSDFLNMLERQRLNSKKISKTRAVTSRLPELAEGLNLHVGPSDHVPWLGDRKSCFIRIDATGFGGASMRCEVQLEVWDSPNSAGVVIDAVRCAKLAMDRGVGGALIGPAAYFMKSPPRQFGDAVAREMVEAFIAGPAKPSTTPTVGG